jgi:prepilin-type N-terminal cleavage/methylation domain-containing protein
MRPVSTCTMSPKNSSPRRASKRGFTLVEIMLVVVIIGMLAMLAYPMIAKSRENAKSARFINDLRNGVHAFELYALQTGYYPEDTGPGIKPADMEDELKRPQWDKTTPIGGSWDWAVDQGDYYAGVVVVGPTVAPSVLQSIDSRIDDGDLSTGIFQSTGLGVVYIIE